MKRSRKNLVITLSVTFVLMTLMVIFISKVVYRSAFNSAQELGNDKAMAITADLENYLDTAKSVLWLTADTVDHMVAKGASSEDIVEYITRESSRTETQFDSSYTGIYGMINGTYVDGVGWTPPEDYDPTHRDWYLITTAARGEVVIVPPYVDAQTGNVIISVGKALTDNQNAMALDLTLNGVQEIVENIRINGYGYGFILNRNGMVIAHKDREENGKYYNGLPQWQPLYEKVQEIEKGNFDINLNGEECTVFVDAVMDQWDLVIIVRNSDLYREPIWLMFVSILINLIVFILISTFYILGYRNERKNNIRLEKMKEVEQKKDYEAKILKLEKSAADSANKAKSHFLADMSHEIRTPINAILGMNEMILHESREEETREYAANIKSAGNTLLSIINSILDFSKIEDGRMSLVPVEFETAALVNELVNSIIERAKAKELDFRVEIDETVPSRLYADDVRISQVISNLLTNAVKYTERGSVLFSIKNNGISEGKCRLLVTVKDTGIGIRKEDINKLAISFERVDEKKNRHIEGTGLGISIVTRLLAMMGSQLKVESEYGVGSEFYFELPVDVADIKPLGYYSVESRSETGMLADKITVYAPKAKVLLTDDNEMNCRVAAKLLLLFGIHPKVCRSGQETIEEMRSVLETGQPYDILFLDHMMPEMDGVETLAALRNNGLIEGTKIIALTANAVVGAKEQYLKAGFDDYLSKPVRLPELDRMLRKYLRHSLLETPREPVEAAVGTGKKNRTLDGEEASSVAAQGASEDSGAAAPDASGIQYEGRLKQLQSIGLSVEDGMTYCADDEAFYVEILHDYLEAAPEKTEKLEAFLQAENMKDYRVVVHALKSASKTIGCMSLFEKALDLENASGRGELEYVREHHPVLMEEYHELLERLKEIIG